MLYKECPIQHSWERLSFTEKNDKKKKNDKKIKKPTQNYQNKKIEARREKLKHKTNRNRDQEKRSEGGNNDR